jgi:hypothetical protein
VFNHPVGYMFSSGVQREMPLGFVVDAAYVGRWGRNLQRERAGRRPEDDSHALPERALADN